MSDHDDDKPKGNALRLETARKLNELKPAQQEAIVPGSRQGMTYHNEQLANPEVGEKADRLKLYLQTDPTTLAEDHPARLSAESGVIKNGKVRVAMGHKIDKLSIAEKFVINDEWDQKSKKDQ